MPSASLWLSIVVVAVLMGVIVTCWLMLRRKRGKVPGRCGKCARNVTGSTSLTCPECGADLRAVGIMQGEPGLKPSKLAVMLAAQLAGWTLIYTAFYGFLGANSYPTPP